MDVAASSPKVFSFTRVLAKVGVENLRAPENVHTEEFDPASLSWPGRSHDSGAHQEERIKLSVAVSSTCVHSDTFHSYEALNVSARNM